MIQKNSVVELHYDLYEQGGELVESTRGSGGHNVDSILYLHGHNQMLDHFERAMTGHDSGDRFDVELPPEQAYGQPKPDASMRVPVKHLQGAKKWRAGMMADVQTEQGLRKVRVVKPGRFMVEVDTNHPLAGKHLLFKVEIISVREATAEELAHGHAHAGGHCHG